MKTSKLIETLKNAIAIYGDVDVKLVDCETGNWNQIHSVLKLHPFTERNGCMNRSQPVDALGITCSRYCADDLILSRAYEEQS